MESEAEGFDLEEALYEFAGVDSTMTAAQLSELLADHDDSSVITDWLYTHLNSWGSKCDQVSSFMLKVKLKPGGS